METSTASKQAVNKVGTLHNTSLLIAQTSKPDLISTAVKEVLITILHKPTPDIIRKMPLSNSSEQGRFKECPKILKNLKTNFNLV